MADIAFLLLIFFLVTTIFTSDRGLLLQLPPKIEHPPQEIPEKEIMSIMINSQDEFLVEGERITTTERVARLVKEHLLNHGAAPHLSSNPQKAIVSIRADRGTTYSTYLAVLDAVDRAYNEIYAAKLGIEVSDWLALNPGGSAVERSMYNRAKLGFPKQVSLAEPTGI